MTSPLAWRPEVRAVAEAILVNLGHRFNRCRSPLPVLMALCLSITPVFGQDYYTQRLDAGRAALSVGDAANAVTELNLACMGMLQDPPSYALCKSFLFLAQIDNSDREAARSTLLLIARLEEQHRAYSLAELDPASRRAVETAVLTTFGQEDFTQAPRFQGLMDQARQEDAASPSDTARTLPELRRDAAANPQDTALQRTLAERLYREGKVVDALDAAEAVIATDSTDEPARCIRSTVTAARNRSLCPGLIERIEQCPAPLHIPFYIETRLRCYTEAEDWNQGLAYLQTLSPATRAGADVEGLARRIEKRADPIAVAPASPEPDSNQTNTVDGADRSGELPSDPDPSIPTEIEAAESGSSTVAEQSQPRSEGTAATEPTADQPTVIELRLDRVRSRAAEAFSARDRASVRSALTEAKAMADQDPELIEAHRLTGELGYLLQDWRTAALYLERARGLGEIGAIHHYYLAVAAYEVGNPSLAVTALRESLRQGLVRTPQVDRYQEKILGRQP